MNDEIKEILEDIKEIYYFKPLLDYITNLQQENERLKEKSINEILKNDFDMCVKDLKKANKKIEKLEDYKSRIEKAVEYIEKEKSNYMRSCDISNATNREGLIISSAVRTCDDTLNILNGRSDE